MFLVVNHSEKLICCFGLCKDSLLDNFINGGRRKAQASIKASLNLGEVIAGDMDNTVNRFLACDHNPDLATAASTDLFYEGLQVDHQIAIVTDVLTNFVHHEQKTEVLALAVNIFLNICNELRDAQFVSFLAVKPISGSLFTHTENRLHNHNDVILKEGKRVACFYPRCAIDFLEGSAELSSLTLPFDEAFQLCDL